MSRRSGRAKAVPVETGHSPETGNSPEIDEQSEITRCICGNDEISTTNAALEQLLFAEYGIKIDNGLFIQCEKCSVWQHGYCVGLFVDNDVPDKYWCEMCKPALHLFVTDPEDGSDRTLYKPVNEGRESLLLYSVDSAKDPSDDPEKAEVKAERPEKATRSRNRRSPAAHGDIGVSSKESANSASSAPSAPNPASRQTRKERRHGEDAYDEQLQRALRESAASSDKKRPRDGENASVRVSGKRTHSEESETDVREAGPEDEGEKTEKSEKNEKKEAGKRERGKNKPRAKQKPKTGREVSKAGSRAGSGAEPEASVVTKEELLQQPSKPRFVSEKSTIYELRKRTGAILEWLGRSQMELEEERDIKTEQFKEANVEAAGLLSSVEENSKLMENLTEKILAWEQRFGKYAP